MYQLAYVYRWNAAKKFQFFIWYTFNTEEILNGEFMHMFITQLKCNQHMYKILLSK